MARTVSLYIGGFSSVSCLGDSTCIISSLEKNATSFNPFMHARLSEIHSLRERISEKTHLEKVFHIISSVNISDICTRRESNLKNIGPQSNWQVGPDWLKQPCHSWPCSREFNIKELPAEETKIPIRVMMAAKTSTYFSSIPQFVLHEYRTFS